MVESSELGKRSFDIKVTGQEGSIPMMGFGTATIKGDEIVEAAYQALLAGYRHLDCALLYGN
jgi:diketogulonate reductase-like aldo/keto reductase